MLTALPGPPTEIRPSEITATAVRLTWTYNGPEEPQYFVIQYKPKYANQVLLFSIIQVQQNGREVLLDFTV